MLPVMWVKFKLPPGRGEDAEEDGSMTAKAAADTGTISS